MLGVLNQPLSADHGCAGLSVDWSRSYSSSGRQGWMGPPTAATYPLMYYQASAHGSW